MSKYDCILTVPLDESEIGLIRQAIDFRRKPAGWRASEYAMTKATAHQDWMKLQPGDNTLDLFNWGILQGELARFHKFAKLPGQTKNQLMTLFIQVQAVITGNQRARQIQEAADDLRDAEADSNKADKVAAAAREKLRTLTKKMEE